MSTIMHTFSITIEIPEEWIRYLTRQSQIFRTPHHAGYWLFGAEQDDDLGWLVYEQGDERRPTEAKRIAVESLWREGKDLPERWYRLDRAAAIRAWEHGVKRWGERWPEFRDGPHEDEVVQLALLGEVRYG